MRKKVVVLIALCFLTGSFELMAQCCSGGVPISSNLGLASKEAGTLQFQLSYDYNTLQHLLAGKTLLDDQSRIRNTHSLLLESSFDLSPSLSVSTLFSIVRQERIIFTQSGTEDLTRNQGLGDAIVLFRYNVIDQKASQPFALTLGIGPKIPLGRSDHRDKRGIILPADLQPGTGAWDGMLWGYFTYQPSPIPNLTFSANTTYRLTSPNLRYNGQQSYRFGNEYQAQAGLSYRLLVNSFLIDPLLIFQYRTVSADRVQGIVLDNTGGHWVFARTGLNLNFSSKQALRLIADIPVYRDLVGTQLSTSFRATISYYHQIGFSKSSSSDLPLDLRK